MTVIRLILTLASLASLSGCGADGMPSAPTAKAKGLTPGVSVSGEAQIGVVSDKVMSGQ